MDVQTENLFILQDFVPYFGRCPKRKQAEVLKKSESSGEVRKGMGSFVHHSTLCRPLLPASNSLSFFPMKFFPRVFSVLGSKN